MLLQQTPSSLFDNLCKPLVTTPRYLRNDYPNKGGSWLPCEPPVTTKAPTRRERGTSRKMKSSRCGFPPARGWSESLISIAETARSDSSCTYSLSVELPLLLFLRLSDFHGFLHLVECGAVSPLFLPPPVRRDAYTSPRSDGRREDFASSPDPCRAGPTPDNTRDNHSSSAKRGEPRVQTLCNTPTRQDGGLSFVLTCRQHPVFSRDFPDARSNLGISHEYLT